MFKVMKSLPLFLLVIFSFAAVAATPLTFQSTKDHFILSQGAATDWQSLSPTDINEVDNPSHGPIVVMITLQSEIPGVRPASNSILVDCNGKKTTYSGPVVVCFTTGNVQWNAIDDTKPALGVVEVDSQ